MNKEERLKVVVENSKIDRFRVVEALKTGWKATGFWYIEERKGLYAFFIDHDIGKAKQHFYLCGILDEYEITKLNSPILDYGLNHFCYVLLSDNLNLIKRYSILKHSNYNKMIDNGSSTASYVLQCLIIEDWLEYERAMVIMRTKTIKKYPAMVWDIQFFDAIAKGDKTKAEEVLEIFVSPKVHKQRNRLHILLNEFISHPALGYAKLAWLKGLEVEVNSPLVPKELLPIKPLDAYTNEYSFLYEVELGK